MPLGGASQAPGPAAHELYLRKLRAGISKRHPKLEVELGLMGLDGKLQKIP